MCIFIYEWDTIRCYPGVSRNIPGITWSDLINEHLLTLLKSSYNSCLMYHYYKVYWSIIKVLSINNVGREIKNTSCYRTSSKVVKMNIFSDYRFSHLIYFGKCLKGLNIWDMLWLYSNWNKLQHKCSTFNKS
jgi:hypothetical protein